MNNLLAHGNDPVRPWWRRHWAYRLSAALVALASGLLFYRVLDHNGVLVRILDGEKLRQTIADLGYWGPLAVIGLMSAAIVLNPLPSAPIALASGAVFGHTWGTLYTVLGAQIGALVAFGIARMLGYEAMRRLLGGSVSLGWLGSQNSLTSMVFLSRLLPFVSFDLASYGAGLTPLKAWRFALATLVGLIPASFLLAHFGGEMASEDLDRALLAALALGVVTLIPIAVKGAAVWRRRRRETGRQALSDRIDATEVVNRET
jgi:uncharacterized membrane protein YdjX (TVP38/TMEM64 family)